MTVEGLMQQTVTVKPRSGYDAYGQPESGTSVSYSARIEPTNEAVIDINGATVVASLVIFMPSSATIAPEDSVNYDGKDWRVLTVAEAVKGSGTVSHLEVKV